MSKVEAMGARGRTSSEMGRQSAILCERKEREELKG